MLHVEDRLDSIVRNILLEQLLRVELKASVKVGLSLAILLLGVSTRCEVAGPVVVSLVSVGEHVIVADWPLNRLFLESVYVL